MGSVSLNCLIMKEATKPAACEKAIRPSNGPDSSMYDVKSSRAPSVFSALPSSTQDRNISDGEAKISVPGYGVDQYV